MPPVLHSKDWPGFSMLVEHIIQSNLTDYIPLKEEEKRRAEAVRIDAVPKIIIPGEVRSGGVPVFRTIEVWIGLRTSARVEPTRMPR